MTVLKPAMDSSESGESISVLNIVVPQKLKKLCSVVNEKNAILAELTATNLPHKKNAYK